MSQLPACLLPPTITTEQLGSNQGTSTQQLGNNYPRTCARTLTSARGDRIGKIEKTMKLLILLILWHIKCWKIGQYKSITNSESIKSIKSIMQKLSLKGRIQEEWAIPYSMGRWKGCGTGRGTETGARDEKRMALLALWGLEVFRAENMNITDK